MMYAFALRHGRAVAVSLTVLGVTAHALSGCYFDLRPSTTRTINANDADGDGFELAGDCNDEDPLVFPGAGENCADGIDNDCDGKVDAADPECVSAASSSGTQSASSSSATIAASSSSTTGGAGGAG